MPNIQVPDESKIPVEGLLLGDVTLTIMDCDGNPVQVHGLMANDLTVRTQQGELIPLAQYILSFAGERMDGDSIQVTDSKGNTYTLKDVVDGLGAIEFTVAQLEQKYANS